MKVASFFLTNCMDLSKIENIHDLLHMFIDLKFELDERSIDLAWFYDENFNSLEYEGRSIWEVVDDRELKTFLITICSKGMQTSLSTTNSIDEFHDVAEGFVAIYRDNTSAAGNHLSSHMYNEEKTFLKACEENIILNEPEKDLFVKYIGKIYKNLYFHPDVSTELNGLSLNYKKILRTILFHLSKINYDFYDMYLSDKTTPGTTICANLSNELSSEVIKIELSRDTNGKPNLYYVFADKEDSRNLNCHLHSKIKGYFEDATYFDRLDRIYFHQPIVKFLSEKILVARIGKHS